MNTEERTITIVDDIMGSGKSTWAINYINDNPDRKFLCIVPLLSECERFKDGTDIDIVDPEKWGSKWKHFRWLVENEKNIVTTHSLIQKMDLDMLELLKSKDYVLMIDECLDVLDTYKITNHFICIWFNFYQNNNSREIMSICVHCHFKYNISNFLVHLRMRLFIDISNVILCFINTRKEECVILPISSY